MSCPAVPSGFPQLSSQHYNIRTWKNLENNQFNPKLQLFCKYLILFVTKRYYLTMRPTGMPLLGSFNQKTELSAKVCFILSSIPLSFLAPLFFLNYLLLLEFNIPEACWVPAPSQHECIFLSCLWFALDLKILDRAPNHEKKKWEANYFWHHEAR